MGFCSKGLKNEFETVMVNEPSVFEPLKFNHIFYFILLFSITIFSILHSTVYSSVKILEFGTPQTISIIVLEIEKFDVTLH